MLQGSGVDEQMVKVANRQRVEYGKSIVTYHDNPLYNTELNGIKYHNSEISHAEDNIIA